MKLETVRREHGITQEQLAKQLGVSQQSVSKYENGSRKIPVDVAKRIGEMFGIPWAGLFDDEH